MGQITSVIRPYIRFMLVLLALGVIVPVTVVVLGVRRITNPITEMINAAQKIVGGDFGQTINVHSCVPSG